MKLLPITAGLALAFTGALSAQAMSDDHDIVDTAAKAGQFKTLLTAAKAAGLVDVLRSKGPFTVFAPTDEAFDRLPKGTIPTLLKPENKARLKAILLYHVVPGNMPAAMVVKAKTLETAQGQSLAVHVKKGVRVGNANVVKTDIKASNGIIHVIDTVLLPRKELNIVQTAAKAGKFNTLLAAAKAAGLVDVLSNKGPLTIFAPTDEAFAKLGKDTIASLLMPENRKKLVRILKAHVVSGKITARDAIVARSAKTLAGTTVSASIVNGRLNVNGAKVVGSDVMAKNGVIHVIDSVILPD